MQLENINLHNQIIECLMMDVIKVASYIFKRYQDETKETIDEMKLHKLMYFAQREAIIQTGSPLFDTQFAAWKYGPVIVEVRNSYRSNSLNQFPTEQEIAPYKVAFDFVFKNYAVKDSWTLSMLTHGESSWKNARVGYGVDDHCDVLIDTNDIVKDAERMKVRRFYFDNIAPKL